MMVLVTDAERLREIRDRLRLTQPEMADRLGTTRATYKNWEYGAAQIPERVLKRLSTLEQRSVQGFSQLQPAPMGTLRILGGIGAGSEPGDSDDDIQSVPIEFTGPDIGGLICEGDSMMPYLHPGDILVFVEHQSPRIGKLFAVRKPNGRPIVKKLIHEKEHGFALKSFNPNQPDITSIDGYELMGFLIGFISPDGGVKVGPFRSGIDERYIDDALRGRLP